MYVCMYVCKYVCMYLYMYACIMYVRIYVCKYQYFRWLQKCHIPALGTRQNWGKQLQHEEVKNDCGLVMSVKEHCIVSSSVICTARRMIWMLSSFRRNIAIGRRREVEQIKDGNTNSHEDETGLE